MIDRLASITGLELWDWFGQDVRPDLERLAALRPFDPDGLKDLAWVVPITGPTVRFDYKTGLWAPIPSIDERLARDYPLGLPVDLEGIRMPVPPV